MSRKQKRQESNKEFNIGDLVEYVEWNPVCDQADDYAVGLIIDKDKRFHRGEKILIKWFDKPDPQWFCWNDIVDSGRSNLEVISKSQCLKSAI